MTEPSLPSAPSSAGPTIAKAFDAKVIVTSVAALLHSGPRADQQYELHSPPGSEPEIRRDSLADHEAELADAKAFFAERGIEAEPVAVSGDPASAIVSLAEQRKADLVIVGTREAGLAERVVRHSVSQEVAKKALRRVHRASAPLTGATRTTRCRAPRTRRSIAPSLPGLPIRARSVVRARSAAPNPRTRAPPPG